jgi:hypothetical protein
VQESPPLAAARFFGEALGRSAGAVAVHENPGMNARLEPINTAEAALEQINGRKTALANLFAGRMEGGR